MKKIIALFLSLTLAATCGAAAFADTMINKSDENQTGTLNVTYTTTETYTVTIPADVTLSSAAKEVSDREVKATDVLLASGSTLTVTVASANGYQLKNGTSAIPYTCKAGNTTITADNNTVLTVSAGTKNPDAVSLTIGTTDADIANATLAGAHTDTLTFTCAVS